MIHVIATISLEPGVRERFLEILSGNVPKVLAEEGCIGYAPTVDIASGIAAQGPLREDTVVIIEAWDSIGSLQAHLQAPHMTAYREQVSALVRSVGLQVLQSA